MIDFDKAEVESTFTRRFQRIVHGAPGRIALRTADRTLTYAELDSASNAIARTILARRGPVEEPVAVLLDHGAASLQALVGILKAGKSIVLLPPNQPPERLATMYRDAQDPLILANRAYRDLARALTKESGQWVDLDEPLQENADLDSVRTGPDSLAAIFYTSGSTGDPKGVMWPHRLVLHTAWLNRERYRIEETDRIAILSAYGFGAAMTMEFAALLNGASILLHTGQELSLKTLTDWLNREKATILSITSLGLFRQQRASMRARANLSSLRLVLIGGEEMFREDVENFRLFFPSRTEIAYRLAGSEAMLIRELRIRSDTKLSEEKVCVGYAVPDKDVVLLDDQGRETPCGEVGEITVRSRYLASGYWLQPELTRLKFSPASGDSGRGICKTGDLGRMLPDGRLEYFGRKDNMVKVRGFRIQLEDVETAVKKLSKIRDGTAAVVDSPDGEKRLAAYLVPAENLKPSIETIRQELSAILPSYMIPSKYVFLDSLPRTATGKIDRPLLPPPNPLRPELTTPFAAPRDEIERRLCAVWAEILALDTVGIHDDFFLLGGDSLLALHMILATEELFGQSVPTVFYKTPTISRLAESLRNTPPVPSTRNTPTAPDKQTQSRRTASPNRAPAVRTKKDRWKKKNYRRRRPGAPLPPIIPRFVRIGAESLALHLPYPLGCRWLSWWYSQGWIVDHFYPGEKILFAQWMDSLGIHTDESSSLLQNALLSNIVWSKRFKRRILLYRGKTFLEALNFSSARFFRSLARLIESSPENQFERFFTFEGLEFLEQARRRGRGVILLTYHSSANRFSIAAVQRRIGGDPIPTISLSYARRLHREDPEKRMRITNEAAMLADAAVAAHHLLQQGAVVQVIPDIGYDAAEGMPLDIAGYHFLVKPGFAELALLSQASIVPQYTTRKTGGRIHIRFESPLDPGQPAQDRRTRIASLLDQYAAFVESAWREAPESLTWSVIDTHLQRPKATS
jgi:amino acid adenylation domain-containing protein